MALKLAKQFKLQGSTLLIERDIRRSKEEFGVVLYDEVVRHFENDIDHFLSTDGDEFIVAVRADLLETHREIAALMMKRSMLRMNAQQGGRNVTRQDADAESPTKRISLLWNKAKRKTEVVIMNQKIQALKQKFGVRVYDKLAELEERNDWKPSDLKVQTAYITCRQNVHRLQFAREHMATAEDTLEDEVAAAVVAMSLTLPPEPEPVVELIDDDEVSEPSTPEPGEVDQHLSFAHAQDQNSSEIKQGEQECIISEDISVDNLSELSEEEVDGAQEDKDASIPSSDEENEVDSPEMIQKVDEDVVNFPIIKETGCGELPDELSASNKNEVTEETISLGSSSIEVEYLSDTDN